MTGCDIGPKGSGKLRNLNIAGARALVVAPKGSISRAAAGSESTETEFLKQLDDGSWVKVRMSDEEGEKIDKTPPDEIYNATDDWLFIAWGFWKEDAVNTWWSHFNIDEAYLVNKSNGDAYDITEVGIPHRYNGYNRIRGFGDVFTDKNGNIYYNNGAIVKITVGKTQATAEWIVSSDLFYVLEFAVDNDGNILYYRNDANYRIRTAGGVTLPLPDDKKPSGVLGYNGHIYTNSLYNSMGGNKFCKVEITGDTIDDIIISPVEIIDSFGQNQYLYSIMIEGYNVKRFIFPDKMVIINGDMRSIFTIYKNGSQPKVVSLDNYLGGSKSITAGSKDIFVWSEKSIFTADPETGITTTKVSATDYDLIYRFEVTFNDVIIINALTFDGKKILANIYPDGRKEILSESMDETKTLMLVKVR